MAGRSVASVTIVGASLAGHASAKALRGYGFAGRITMVGGEEHRPYDRPPLSKEFLAGRATIDELALETEDEDLDAEWLLGARAVGLGFGGAVAHDPAGPAGGGAAGRPADGGGAAGGPADGAAAGRTAVGWRAAGGPLSVWLADGRTVTSDAVVIATGSFAKTFDAMPAGVHTLRTLDDAIALRNELRAGARLVVVGSGFVGLEVASTARDLGLEVTVLGSSDRPLSGIFGAVVASAVQRLQENHGVTVRNNVRVVGVRGHDRVSSVRLATGEEIAADIVVLGIGSIPAVDWLEGSGLDVAAGVVCDQAGATAVPGVFAVGDCSAWYDPVRGRPHRIEHWTDSRDRPAIAMAALLDVETPARALRPSYLWSDQCGARIQFAGRLLGGENGAVEAGNPESDDLLVVYRREGDPVAVVGINQPKLVAQWRKRLTAQPHSVASVRPAAVPASSQPV